MSQSVEAEKLDVLNTLLIQQQRSRQSPGLFMNDILGKFKIKCFSLSLALETFVFIWPAMKTFDNHGSRWISGGADLDTQA